MALVKHPEHGNKHVTDEEAVKLAADGWITWPRKSDVKGPRGQKLRPVAKVNIVPPKR